MQHQPAKSQALALAARQLDAALADQRFQAVGQLAHPAFQADLVEHLGKTAIGHRVIEGQVLAQAAIENGWFLGNVSHLRVVRGKVDLRQILAVHQHLALLWADQV